MPGPALTSRFSRARGLPRPAYDSWVDSLSAEPGRSARVLAWAPVRPRDGEDQFCIGSPSVLSAGGASGWGHVGWHVIEHGGWNAELRQLSWALLDGHRGAVQADDPGRLPELFRERVEATIVVKRYVSLAGDRGVLVSARRDLGAAGTISWHTRLTRGLSLATPGIADAVDLALAETRAEYDLR
ncbi:hypothetical protein [uncultured Friedmanniella sp.]|uniref:hypothetical protein n=1 Tax=uncultured Friedmanniella sp. TaxID=335381 RepID=UPI0035C9E642